MPVLSVDLACRSWSDLGVVLLEQKGPQIVCDIIRWNEPYSPPVVELALRLNQICVERGAGVLMLDGPQAWKSEEASRADLSEPSGSSGIADSYERFVGYCLALYDALGRLGWQRLAAQERSGKSRKTQKLLVESYPHAAWNSLGIAPLPARKVCRVSHLAEAYASLTALLPITSSQPPNHNQMQAIVGGLPGLAIEDRKRPGLRAAPGTVGWFPKWQDEQWRQGFHVQPAAPVR